MEAPPSVVILDAAMQHVNQLAAVKSQHVGAKSLLVGAKSLLVAVKSLHVVVKSLLAVAKAIAAIQVATVLVAKSVDADSWRNFSLRRATATDASQHVVAKSLHVVAKATAASQYAVAKSQLVVARATAATQVATAAVLLRSLADCSRSCSEN